MYVVDTSFYVDDCLTGANSIQEAVELQRLSSNDNYMVFLQRENSYSGNGILTTTLCYKIYLRGTQRGTTTATHRLSITVAKPPPLETLTKRALGPGIWYQTSPRHSMCLGGSHLPFRFCCRKYW